MRGANEKKTSYQSGNKVSSKIFFAWYLDHFCWKPSASFSKILVCVTDWLIEGPGMFDEMTNNGWSGEWQPGQAGQVGLAATQFLILLLSQSTQS